MKILYAALCVIGLALPYYFFVPFLLEHGPDLSIFMRQLFSTAIGGVAAMDLLISTLALWVFIYQENRKHHIPLWPLAIVGNLAVGVSFGLPLFLLLREIAVEPNRSA